MGLSELVLYDFNSMQVCENLLFNKTVIVSSTST